MKGTLHRHILAGAVILAEQGRPFYSFPQLWREMAARKLKTKQFGCGFRRRCWFLGGGQGKVDAVLTHFLLSDDRCLRIVFLNLLPYRKILIKNNFQPMKTNPKNQYESPRTDVLEVKIEGIICDSGDLSITGATGGDDASSQEI